MRRLQAFSGTAHFLLRFVSGAMFSFHGAQKLFGFLSEHPRPPFGTQIWFGGVIEFFGGLMIALGVRTRSAAFICSGTMAVAYTQFHWKLALDKGIFPAINQGELALLYAFVFLFLACSGGGPWCLTKD